MALQAWNDMVGCGYGVGYREAGGHGHMGSGCMQLYVQVGIVVCRRCGLYFTFTFY